jgi:hypothetical protein
MLWEGRFAMRFWGFAALPQSGGDRDVSAIRRQAPAAPRWRMSTLANSFIQRERLFDQSD